MKTNNGVGAARCPMCGAPMKSMKPMNLNAMPMQAPATPAERGAGKLAPAPPTVPAPSPANKTQKKVSN